MSEKRKTKKLYIIIALSLLMLSCQSKEQAEGKQNDKQIKLSSIENNIDTELSDTEIKEIKLLAETIAFSKPSSIRYMTDEDTVLDSTREQALFLFKINTMSDENIIKKTLEKTAVFGTEGMKLSEDGAKKIIESAGGKTQGSSLWDYISAENKADASEIDVKAAGNEFIFPIINKHNLENYREYKNWEFIKEGNGNLRLKFSEYLEPEDIHVHDLELELYKNNESIFAGYSAKKFTKKLALPNDVKVNFICSDVGYTAPESLSKDMKDYTFKLEGKNYTLPAPVKAFTDGGWQLNLADIPKRGSKSRAELVKGDKKIEVSVYNCMSKDEETDLYVIWLKVDNEGRKNIIDFELSGAVKNADKRVEDKKYYFLDALYNDEFGTKITFDSNNTVSGFEISYAPYSADRIEQINALSTDKATEEIKLEADIKNMKLDRGKIYLIPTSNNEKIIRLELKYLDKVAWGKYTVCLVKDGKELGIYNSTYGRFIEYPEITLDKDTDGSIYVLIKGCDSRNNEGEEKVYITR